NKNKGRQQLLTHAAMQTDRQTVRQTRQLFYQLLLLPAPKKKPAQLKKKRKKTVPKPLYKVKKTPTRRLQAMRQGKKTQQHQETGLPVTSVANVMEESNGGSRRTRKSKSKQAPASDEKNNNMTLQPA